MAKGWEEVAVGLGVILCETAKVHNELEPLVAAHRNFMRKRFNKGISVSTKAETARLNGIISRQSDEIAALEFRIKTLEGR